MRILKVVFFPLFLFSQKPATLYCHIYATTGNVILFGFKIFFFILFYFTGRERTMTRKRTGMALKITTDEY
jgi:hypothetical protein